ncbi:hypothetical protein F5X68DRAFT_198058 [Plectosphaerella plurivora]|uniref:N-acetyltransferase domain-containing protein n=1 Tax=Plectosphaerella plurivora TaxID=936078 RepID=A0A9P8VIK8_9PEZI|nr:hypothetical protein F5X68DRAFT_198058 [Plectosphaerella plurivora]
MSPPSPFALVTSDIIFLPTPWAGEVEGYRTLFRKLHADAAFCQIAFGGLFGPVEWSDEETRRILIERDGAIRWGIRGMGDWALGMLPTNEDGSTAFHTLPGRLLKHEKEQVRLITGDAFDELLRLTDHVQWVGYTCVRDATTAGGTITDTYKAGEEKDLPPWQEMVEIRYGMDPGFTGRGIATRAAQVVMSWSIEEHGVRRFIGATMNGNFPSQKMLRRLGFKESDTDYFKEKDLGIEWTKDA